MELAVFVFVENAAHRLWHSRSLAGYPLTNVEKLAPRVKADLRKVPRSTSTVYARSADAFPCFAALSMQNPVYQASRKGS